MLSFSVPTMSCDKCKAKIEDALLEADGGAELVFDMAARNLQIDTVLESAEITALLQSAGYATSPLG